jgi:hypothetical protein
MGRFLLGRVPRWAVVVTAVGGIGGCASIEGLDQFNSEPGCTSGCRQSGSDATTMAEASQPDENTPTPDVVEPDATDIGYDGPSEWVYDASSGDDSPVDAVAVVDGGEDGSLADAEGGVRDAAHDAVATVADAEGGSADAGADAHVVDAAHEASVDAATDAPACNSNSCPEGCCTASGSCAGGGLTAACGMGGAACQNCANYGLACVNQACVTPPADGGSGPTGCHPSTCSNLCVPYFVQCCKADQSCGCALLFPPGSCN